MGERSKILYLTLFWILLHLKCYSSIPFLATHSKQYQVTLVGMAGLVWVVNTTWFDYHLYDLSNPIGYATLFNRKACGYLYHL